MLFDLAGSTMIWALLSMELVAGLILRPKILNLGPAAFHVGLKFQDSGSKI